MTTRVSGAEVRAASKVTRSKFNVRTDAAGKEARTYGGIVYDSAAEMRYAQLLDVRTLAGDIIAWWRQIPFQLSVAGVPICKIVADFKILHNDKSTEIVEVKGVQTSVYRLKRKIFEAQYAAVKYTVVDAKRVK